ncbi:MAG: autotransporter domain-containing protein, partial [Akkermansia sp.]|nr:autotransporter domain-containing protein [Akkermansia sp.]
GTELIKSGSGKLVVEGNLSADVLVVQDGTLSLNGADNTDTTLQLAAGILQLGSGSSLVVQNSSGSGTVSIASGGSLLLDNVTSEGSAWNIDNQGQVRADITASGNLTLGTLTMAAGSVNELVLDTDGPVNNSLSLQGLRVQPGVSRVQLVSAGARLLRSGEYVIGSVGSTDVQGRVQLSLSGLPFAQLLPGESYLYVDGGNIVLHAERSPQNLLLSAVDSPNSAAGAQLLWNAEPTEHGDLSRAYAELQQLIASGQEAAARRAMAAVAGSSLAVMGPALSEDVERQLRSIRNRTAAMGVNPCVVNENMPYCNFWVQAEGDYRHLSAAGDSPGYKFQRWGGTAGMDVDFNPAFTAGLAVTGLYGELSSDSPDTLDCDVSSWYLSAFARYQDRPWVHSFIATLGWVNADPERRVQVGGMQYRTEGSTSGHSFGFMYELAYNWQPDSSDPSFTLQPLLNISYRHSSLSGYTERGSDAALHVDPQSMDALRLSLGARLQSEFGENIFNRSSMFEFRALLGMDIGDRRGHADVALVN